MYMKRKNTMKSLLSASLLLISLILPSGLTQAQEAYLGELRWFGFTFCPRGWLDANGQLLDIWQNDALFSLYGTTYGGDGRTNFGLPDLRGRVSLHTGQGPGLPNFPLGSKGGKAATTLTTAQMPEHRHTINVSSGAASYSDGSNGVLGSAVARNTKKNGDIYIYDGPGTANQQLAADSMADTGGGESHNNMQPYLTLRACVATVGTYPSRS
jgi:microcystin-dependent protein